MIPGSWLDAFIEAMAARLGEAAADELLEWWRRSNARRTMIQRSPPTTMQLGSFLRGGAFAPFVRESTVNWAVSILEALPEPTRKRVEGALATASARGVSALEREIVLWAARLTYPEEIWPRH